MKKNTPDFRAILRTLRRHQVDFIVVGGVCGVLQGAPINTFDLDVVHSRDPKNLDRLLKALEALGLSLDPLRRDLKPLPMILAPHQRPDY